VSGVEGRPRLLLATMSAVALTVAVLQTAVVPILGVIARQLAAPTVDVSWAVTANLLAAVAATPLIGRLADLFVKKRVLLVVLAVVLAGSVLAAVTSSLPLLIVARVMQGVSFALYPIGVSILREELPAERLMSSMAVLSGVLGFGGGAGLVVTGLLMRGDAGYHRVFWFTVLFTVGVIVAVIAAVPERPRTGGGTVDWLGAIGLAAGLSAILLAITQGPAWGWSSPRTAAALVIGIAILIGWWRWEQHCRQPLVSTAMLSRRPILLTNIATVSVGMGLYFAFLGLTDFVQAPAGSGYGFGASVLAASVQFLLPGAMAGFITATVSGRYIDRFGARPILLIGGAIGVVGFAGLAAALLQSEPARAWQVILGAGADQRLHQPGVRRHSGPCGSRGRSRRDCGGHVYERHRQVYRQFGGRRAGGGAAESRSQRLSAGEQFHCDLRSGGRHRDRRHRVDRPEPAWTAPDQIDRGSGEIPRDESRVGLTAGVGLGTVIGECTQHPRPALVDGTAEFLQQQRVRRDDVLDPLAGDPDQRHLIRGERRAARRVADQGALPEK
jgi:MFS family permease